MVEVGDGPAKGDDAWLPWDAVEQLHCPLALAAVEEDAAEPCDGAEGVKKAVAHFDVVLTPDMVAMPRMSPNSLLMMFQKRVVVEHEDANSRRKVVGNESEAAKKSALLGRGVLLRLPYRTDCFCPRCKC